MIDNITKHQTTKYPHISLKETFFRHSTVIHLILCKISIMCALLIICVMWQCWIYTISLVYNLHVHPTGLQPPLRHPAHHGSRLPQHQNWLRRQVTPRRRRPLRKLNHTQYVQVNKTTGEKVELDFYNSFAKENSDPESILENCFIDDW